MKPLARTLALAASIAAVAALVPDVASARSGGAGGGWHSGAGGGWHSGAGWHGGSGHWHGGHWGHRGYWPGAFWGGVGLGIGIGAIGYYGLYGPGYYYAPAWGTYYYDTPVVVAPTYVEAAPGARTGQPVAQNTRAPEAILYKKKGESAEATENDRRECNRWATTQQGAMADASIFQRATLACMEGRGYTVK